MASAALASKLGFVVRVNINCENQFEPGTFDFIKPPNGDEKPNAPIEATVKYMLNSSNQPHKPTVKPQSKKRKKPAL